MDAEELSKRCVLFKKVPCNTSANQFCQWLDKIQTLRHVYTNVQPHVESEGDERWIVLFKNEKDAMKCIEMAVINIKMDTGETVRIIPDYCSECIVPDIWITDYEECVEDISQENQYQSLVQSYKSIQSDDLFGDGGISHLSGNKLKENTLNWKASDETVSNEEGGIASDELFGSGKESRPVSTVSSVSSSDMYGSGRDFGRSYGFEGMVNLPALNSQGKLEEDKVGTSHGDAKEVEREDSSQKRNQVAKSETKLADENKNLKTDTVIKERKASINSEDVSDKSVGKNLEHKTIPEKAKAQQRNDTMETVNVPKEEQENNFSSERMQSQPNVPGQFPLYGNPYGAPFRSSDVMMPPHYMQYAMMQQQLAQMMPQGNPTAHGQGQDNVKVVYVPFPMQQMMPVPQGMQMPQMHAAMPNFNPWSYGMIPQPNQEQKMQPFLNPEEQKRKEDEDKAKIYDDTYINPISENDSVRSQSTEVTKRHGVYREKDNSGQKSFEVDSFGPPVKRQSSIDVKDEEEKVSDKAESEPIYSSINETKLAGDRTIGRISEKRRSQELPQQPPFVPKRASSTKKMHRITCIDDSEAINDDDVLEKTIKLEGIPPDVDKDLIELFIESQDSGAEVISMSVLTDEQVAIVELKYASTVEMILKKQQKMPEGCFMLKKKKVKISVYTPPPKDPKKVFISGMKDGTSSESLQNFIEVCSEHAPTSIEAGLTPGTALLSFDTPPDVNSLREKLNRRSLEDHFLEISTVEVTQSIKVKGYDPDFSRDALLYYFENAKRSGGGEVDRVEYQNENNVHIVHFLKPEDAINACKRQKHEVSEVVISVSLYYPCLDLSKEYRLVVPEPLEMVHLDPYIVRFLSKSSPYRMKFEVSMKQKCFASVMFPSELDGTLKITCDVDPKVNGASEKLKDWELTCRQEVDALCSDLDVNDQISVAKEVWSGVIERLQNIEISEPDMVMINIKREDYIIVVVGLKDWVLQFSGTISDMVSELEQKLAADKQTITKSKVLKTYEAALLRVIRFSEKSSTSGLSVSMTDRQIEFNGSVKDVDDCIQKMYHRLKEFAHRSVLGYTKTAKDLLFQIETRKHIRTVMKRLVFVWDVRKGADLVIYSRNEKDLDEVIILLQKTLQQKEIPLDSRMSTLMRSKEWQSHLSQITNNSEYTGLMTVEEKFNEIRIVGVNVIIQNVYAEIMKFFDLHGNISEFMNVEPGRFLYIVRNKKLELEDIERQYSSLNVRIERVDKDSRKGFKIHGKKDGCRLAITRLQKIVDNVTYKDLKISNPGFKDFLLSSEGKVQLQSIEISEKCILLPEMGEEDESPMLQKTDMPKEAAACKMARCAVSVMEGDITSLNVDMIVNPTVSSLQHAMGLGSAIVDKGGFGIQKQCDEYVRKKGSLSYADTFISEAGKLPCKKITHVVMPTWNGGVSNEGSILRQAVEHCFTDAEICFSKSIALPIIGAGTFRYPLDVAARNIVEMISRYASEKVRSTSIQQIYLCDRKSANVQVFIDELKLKLGSSEIKVYKDQDSSNSSGVSRGSERGPERNRGNPRITVVEGELAKQTADVIVNSTNQNLDLKVGIVSKGLLQAGGEVIQKECMQKYPEGVGYGEIARTSGGALNCKKIFHGMLHKWDRGQGPAENVMGTFIQRCLNLAENVGYTSIAFPALGTGNLGFPPEVTAKLMFACVHNYSFSNLKEVKLVVWHGDVPAVKAFRDVADQFKNQQQTGGRRQRTVSEVYQPSVDLVRNRVSGYFRANTSNGKDFKTTIENVTVEIQQGDITKQKTGAIVNSVLKEMKLSTGRVSRAILEAAGMSIQTECLSTLNRMRMEKDGFVVTQPGKLLCQRIIHMKAKSSAQGWEKMICRCLEEVETLGLNSVSFPALGTGGRGCTPDSMARLMLSSFRQYIRSKDYKQCLKSIRIVIYETDMLDAFIKSVQPEGPSISSKVMDIFRSKKTLISSAVIHVYTDSLNQLVNVKRKLDGLFTEHKVYLPKLVLEKMDKKEINRIIKMGELRNIDVALKQRDALFTLQGYGDSILHVKADIKNYIDKLDKDYQTEGIASSVLLPKSWSKMTLKDSVIIESLSTSSTEYMRIYNKFLSDGIRRTIIKIERIQNPTLYTQYDAHKRSMEQTNKGSKFPIEQCLWHGTSGIAAESINKTGFNRNFNSGASHGAGVYFAVRATTSLSYCRPDAKGSYHMYYAHVLTGEYCVGSQGIRHPPAKSGLATLNTYDSTTDNVQSPNFFVIFHDAKAYPSYHIEFQ